MPTIDRTKGYALEGRVVTMGPAGVIEDGAVYVRGNRIVAVKRQGEPAPSGMGAVERVRSGDTIYPGLIELQMMAKISAGTAAHSATYHP